MTPGRDPIAGMSDWTLVIPPGEAARIKSYSTEEVIATLAGNSSNQIRNGRLLVAAPVLRNAVRLAAQIFSLMASHGSGREQETGAEMLAEMNVCLEQIGEEPVPMFWEPEEETL